MSAIETLSLQQCCCSTTLLYPDNREHKFTLKQLLSWCLLAFLCISHLNLHTSLAVSVKSMNLWSVFQSAVL